MRKIVYTFGYFIFLFSCNTFANPVNLILGSIQSNEGNERPFVIKGNELMNEWQLSNAFSNLPKEVIKWFILESATCVDRICLSVGGYNTFSNPNNPQAIVTLSKDEGFSWIIKNVTPQNIEKADLKNVSCTNNICTAIGFQVSNNIKLPLILKTHDYFQTWQQIPEILGFDNKSSLSSFKSYCTNEYCVIAASQTNDNINGYANKIVFLSSKNNIEKWSMTSSLLPESKDKVIVFQNISCSGQTCGAVGISTHNLFNDLEPLIYVSQDNGVTWNKKDIEVKLGRLNSVKCKNNFCIAVGNAYVSNTENKGIAVVSHDNGTTWQTIELKNSYGNQSSLYDVDCTDRFCVIGGNDEPPHQLLLYVSEDQGNTWAQIENILPSVDYLRETALSCNKENCLYTLENYNYSTKILPIILTSDVSGKKWQVITNILNIPDQISGLLVDANYHDQSATTNIDIAKTNSEFNLSKLYMGNRYRVFK